MTSRFCVLFFMLSSGIHGEVLSPETLQQAAELRDQAQASDLGYEIVESLTTEVGPRMAGTDGDARAVAWGKAKFEELGFDRVALEPVTFPVWERRAESGSVVSPFPQPLVLTALGGSISTPASGLQAPIARFENMEALKAIPDDSLDGAIAYVAFRMERAQDGSGYGPAVVARRDGASVAAAKGASAILIRSIGTDNDRMAHTGLMRYAEDTPRIPAAALANPDADLLDNMLKRADEVVVRLDLDVGETGEYTSHNVVGDITGTERPDEIVIIGCHLDSWDLGTGAIDDGAGCGITMAAATLIARSGLPLSRTLRVVLFSNEEQGLIGARAYREAHANALKRHIIGAESDFGAGRIYKFSSRVKPEALGIVDQITQVLAPLGIVRGNNDAFGGPDLVPMRASGMAVATLHQDGSDYFDYHHTANDTLDKIDPEALAQNVAAYAVFAFLAANAPGDFGFGLGAEKP